MARKQFNLAVPGLKNPTGLGSAIKRTTTRAGVKPCGGCNRRAAWLDAKINLVPRGGKK